MPEPISASRLRARLKPRQLAALAAIAGAGSLRRAASALGVSQPALSRTLRELEEAVGRPLFQRDPKGLVPTPHGRAAIVHAERHLRDVDALAATLAAIDAGAEGRLRLGVIPSVSSDWLRRTVESLLAGPPAFTLEVTEGPTDVLIAALRAREIDCVVGRVTAAIASSDLRWRPLFEQALRIVVRARHPLLRRGARIELAHLADYEWILPAATTPTRQLVDHLFVQAGLAPPRARLETYALRLLEALVASHDFPAAVPDDIARQLCRDGAIRTLPFAWPMPPICLVWTDASLPLVTRLGHVAGLARDAPPQVR